MKLHIKMAIALCILLFRCANPKSPMSDLTYCNTYYKKHFTHHNTPKKEYAILYSKAGCFSCDQGYFDRLIPRIKKSSFRIYASQRNLDSILQYHNLNSGNYQQIPKKLRLEKQYFMRHILVVLKIDTVKNEVIEFTPITSNNINSLKLD